MNEFFIVYIVLSIIAGFFYAELIGYILHVILHSNRIRYLSKSHMIHHLRLYGPKMPQRSTQYKVAVRKRLQISGIGMEWLLPLFIVILATVAAGLFLNAPLLYLTIFVVMALVWGSILFAYMHNAMHIEGFWMTKNRIFKKWFLTIRQLHVIHHLELSDDGKMNKNYGICFFFFDRLFQSFQKHIIKFNEKGFGAAQKRYDYIYKMEI